MKIVKEKFIIWYTLYCPQKSEMEMLPIWRGCLTRDAAQDIFVLTYDRMRRYEGAWHMERQLLFPCRIFLETNNAERLVEELERYAKKPTAFGKVDSFISMDPEEQRFLLSVCGEEHHIQMSRGYIQNGRTYVTEGPLKGKERLIRKIDRHKRVARVRVPGQEKPGEARELQMGLEIVKKS